MIWEKHTLNRPGVSEAIRGWHKSHRITMIAAKVTWNYICCWLIPVFLDVFRTQYCWLNPIAKAIPTSGQRKSGRTVLLKLYPNFKAALPQLQPQVALIFAGWLQISNRIESTIWIPMKCRYKVVPPSYRWIIIPLTINISPINHHYWTYKPTSLTMGHHPVYMEVSSVIGYLSQIIQVIRPFRQVTPHFARVSSSSSVVTFSNARMWIRNPTLTGGHDITMIEVYVRLSKLLVQEKDINIIWEGPIANHSFVAFLPSWWHIDLHGVSLRLNAAKVDMISHLY